jgi:predicted ATP-grasp superfamily ATP-dependent carboligase
MVGDVAPVKVFVTDGDNRAALAVTRSLGRLGHEVIVGEKRTPALAQTSRYCRARVVYPDPIARPDAFVQWLTTTVRARGVDAVIPISDVTTLTITENRAAFDARCAIPFASADIVARAADKVDVLQTAARLGVGVPRSVVVGDGRHVPETDFGYPVVVKPHRSRVKTAAGWTSTAVSYAIDPAALRRDLAARPRHEFPVLLQERIIGPGFGVFACYQAGRAVALFSHRRLRERPPWGGVSVLSESVAMCPVARDQATRLLDELGWHGVAMVEFKRDARDGLPKLMEINGRFWGSLQLAIDAGVDFPALLLRSACGDECEPQEPYRIGVRNRWLWGDVDSLLVTLFGGNGAPELEARPKWPALRAFAKCWGTDLHYDNPKWGDAKPWLFESYEWFRRTAADAGTTLGIIRTSSDRRRNGAACA